jgi:hypothetical protein
MVMLIAAVSLATFEGFQAYSQVTGVGAPLPSPPQTATVRTLGGPTLLYGLPDAFEMTRRTCVAFQRGRATPLRKNGSPKTVRTTWPAYLPGHMVWSGGV